MAIAEQDIVSTEYPLAGNPFSTSQQLLHEHRVGEEYDEFPRDGFKRLANVCNHAPQRLTAKRIEKVQNRGITGKIEIDGVECPNIYVLAAACFLSLDDVAPGVSSKNGREFDTHDAPNRICGRDGPHSYDVVRRLRQTVPLAPV
jgi:hypothetical protein